MKTTFCLCLLGIAVFGARAEDVDPQAAARTVVENEKKFYEMGQEQGTRAAFLEFLAPDSIVFHPGPVNGKREWEKRPAAGISLKWEPSFIGMARSADLAFTTGPAEWRKAKEDEKPFGYGQFVSIWKKQKDGTWKVAVDVGTEAPGAPKEKSTEIEYAAAEAPAAHVSTEKSAIARMLRNAEGKFANVARTDSTAAVLGSASPSIWVLRDGVFPAVTRDAAGLMLSVRGTLTHEKMGGGMSDAGDLAYSYGKYTFTRPDKTERGYYVQIWRAQADGAFKLALDLQTPLPAEAKK